VNRSHPNRILGFVAWFLGASPTGAVGEVRYTITELPMHRAWAINDQGIVAGEVGSIPARWHNGQLDLAPGVGADGPWDINNAGVIVGGGLQGYRWEGDVRTPLPTLDGLNSSARGINESDQIVGWLGGDVFSRACLWQGGNVTTLGALGGEYSGAYAINEAGDVVGWATTGPPGPTTPGPYQAFLYSNGVMSPIVGPHSIAYDINDAGQVVGKAVPGKAFLWEGGDWAILPDPGAGVNGSEALSINNEGHAVGYASVANYDHAVLWDSAESASYYLEDLIPSDSGWSRLIQATDINDAGQIVGWGRREGSAWHAFLLTPIPEPTSVTLLLLCMLALPSCAGHARRRKPLCPVHGAFPRSGL
jgi:probable HAF family extracellular repeat protein